MISKLPNEMTVKANLKRIDICDLILACGIMAIDTEAKKWQALHDKLEKILDDFDEAHGISVFKL